MDFWTVVAAVIIGASIWKFLDGFWSDRDKQEKHWQSLSPQQQQAAREEAERLISKD